MPLLREPGSSENALGPLFSFRLGQERDARTRGHDMLRIGTRACIRVRRSWKLLWEGIQIARL